MSFFYDFFKYFDIKDLVDKTTITTIVGYGAVICGNLKIKEISEDFIYLYSKKDKVKIYGFDLKIKSIAKGEIVVAGKINKCELGEQK